MRYKVIEYRTIPYIFEVEASNEDDAQEKFEAGQCTEIGHDDCLEAWNEVEELKPGERIVVENSN